MLNYQRVLSNLHDVFKHHELHVADVAQISFIIQHQSSRGLETRRFAIQKDELILRYLQYRNDQCFFPQNDEMTSVFSPK